MKNNIDVSDSPYGIPLRDAEKEQDGRADIGYSLPLGSMPNVSPSHDADKEYEERMLKRIERNRGKNNIAYLKDLDTLYNYHHPENELNHRYNLKFQKKPIETFTRKVKLSIRKHDYFLRTKEKKRNYDIAYRIRQKQRILSDPEFANKQHFIRAAISRRNGWRRTFKTKRGIIITHLAKLRLGNSYLPELTEIETIILTLNLKEKIPLFKFAQGTLKQTKANLPAIILTNNFYKCPSQLETYRKLTLRKFKELMKEVEVFEDGQGKLILRAMWLLKQMRYINDQ